MSITPADAAAQLAADRDIARRTSVFNLAWVAFIFLAAGASMILLNQWLVENHAAPLLPGMLLGLLWVLAGVSLFLVRPRQRFARRGFGKRWVITIVLWSSLYGIGLALADTPVALIIAVLLPVFAALRVAQEHRTVASVQ